MGGKSSFVLYGEIEDHLDGVSDEDCGRLFRAVLQYANRGEIAELSGEVKMAFRFIRSQLDRDAAKWAETSKKRAAAGAKGGVKSGETRRGAERQTETNKANASFALSDEAKEADNVPVSVPVPVSAPEDVTDPVNNLLFVGDDGARARTCEEDSVGDFLDERGQCPERYFGFTDETQAQAEQIAREIFSHYSLKPPTKMDITNVFEYTRASIQPEDPADHDSWRIEFPKDKIDLLMYAFEAAAEAGSPGNWRYIRGVMAKLHGRKITTLDQADTFDYDRVERRGRHV